MPNPTPSQAAHDAEYLGLVFKALDVCAKYKPKFGQGAGGRTLKQFRALYSADAFYSWFGLDSPLMYAAHKAAGGMTSVYRQIGKGCEWVFNRVLQHSLGLSHEEANWQFEVPVVRNGKKAARTLTLDGRIPLASLKGAALTRVRAWLNEAGESVSLSRAARSSLHGAVFEVRQGYKSMDSKRQNADVDFAARALAENHLPVFCVLSSQINPVLVSRYGRAAAVVLVGDITGTATESTYTFARDVVGYDLGAFFKRNERQLHERTDRVLRAILESK